MNVLHVTNRLDHGGVDSLLLQLLPVMNNEGINVSVLVLDARFISLVEEFEREGIKVYFSRFYTLYNPLVLIFLFKIAKKFDIIHAHLFPTQYYVALLKLFYPKKKYVTTEHCTINKRRQYAFFSFVEKWVYKAYDVKIGVSKAATKKLSSWIKDTSPITIVNGINLTHIYEAEPYSKDKIGIPLNSKTIVMVARFFDQKDHITAIKSMQWLSSEYHLIFVGGGETLDYCKQYALSIKVEKQVHFLGQRSDVASIIKTCDVCLLSTFYEGLSIAVIEYLAAGKATIGSNVDGVKELIDDENLLFPVGDDKKLAEIIKYLFADDIIRKKIGIKNQQKAKEFDLKKMADEYIQTYKSLLI